MLQGIDDDTGPQGSSSYSPTRSQNSKNLPTHLISGPQLAKDENIVRMLKSLSVDVQDLVKEVRSLRNIIEVTNGAQNIQLPEEIEDMEIPISNMAKFVIFDEKLNKENSGFRNRVARSLHLHIDRDGVLSKSIKSMPKHYLSRTLLLLFTAVKKTEGKEVFSETNFCKIIMGVLNAQHAKNGKSPIKKSVFYKQLGNVISNAIDWDGNRKKRKERREANLKKKNNAIPENENSLPERDNASPRTDDTFENSDPLMFEN
ncbi:uncharacterized protein LOC124185022 [Neodiprion fabricii]|uniref:uncharacterized protein LOC124185022 n=1 Tax=Neodiprion fabricii TaxID=2872261 RepID=UPI001ED90EC6|nr:uncharacterized protein LOC124185022 [Neodiprion fabricii]